MAHVVVFSDEVRKQNISGNTPQTAIGVFSLKNKSINILAC